ncbi:hypothetical protein R515_13405 [Salmonella enterica subsp. arizonae serovar 41:z4,z23:-]|nr:hypothetical protein [Salmonella enterica]OSE57825.1 hypothetical protein R515_13405 [Salmonella enterica subsp. arizonae serovar 41:z4,z23:-]EEG8231837.1 hypothetical protein [Salmonella enterica]EJH0529611.1 hypothetical protein [Salmonella enterica]ELJ1342528.1 hypothetical protein [Salmonella enterica]
MSKSAIKDNDVMYQKKYPRDCLFKLLQLRTNLKAKPDIYRVEMINRKGENILMGGRKTTQEAIALYQDIATLSATEVEMAFSSMV